MMATTRKTRSQKPGAPKMVLNNPSLGPSQSDSAKQHRQKQSQTGVKPVDEDVERRAVQHAKAVAQENAIWKHDKPRKRLLSVAQDSEKVKVPCTQAKKMQPPEGHSRDLSYLPPAISASSSAATIGKRPKTAADSHCQPTRKQLNHQGNTQADRGSDSEGSDSTELGERQHLDDFIAEEEEGDGVESDGFVGHHLTWAQVIDEMPHLIPEHIVPQATPSPPPKQLGKHHGPMPSRPTNVDCELISSDSESPAPPPHKKKMAVRTTTREAEDDMIRKFGILRTSSPDISDESTPQNGMKRASTSSQARGRSKQQSTRKELQRNEIPQWKSRANEPGLQLPSRAGRPRKALPDQQSDENWHKSTHLVLDGDKLLITLQSQTIRQLLTSTFSETEALLSLENAFPDIVERDKMIKKAMRNVARDLGAEFKAVRERVSLLRTEVKTSCANAVIVAYNLHSNAAKTVNDLLDEFSSYIFPVDTTVRNKDGNLNVQYKSPYQNPAIIAVLRLFFTPSVKLYLGEQYHHHFIPADNGLPQLPDSLVAFVATGVHGALTEYQTGSRVQVDFTANRFASVFKNHLDRLKAIALENPKAYRKLMHLLYSLAKNSDVSKATVSKALGKIDLTLLAESD